MVDCTVTSCVTLDMLLIVLHLVFFCTMYKMKEPSTLGCSEE